MIFFIFYEIVYVKKNLEDLIKCRFVVSYMQKWQLLFVLNKLWDFGIFGILILVDFDIFIIVLILVVIDILGFVFLVVEGFGFVWIVDGDLQVVGFQFMMVGVGVREKMVLFKGKFIYNCILQSFK